MPTTIECFKPGDSVVVIHQNRIHSAEVISVAIALSSNFHQSLVVNKTYSVTLDGNRGSGKLDIHEVDVALNREQLIEKL